MGVVDAHLVEQIEVHDKLAKEINKRWYINSVYYESQKGCLSG